MLEPGCREELSLRAASIVAVERVRDSMVKIIDLKAGNDTSDTSGSQTSDKVNGVSSVLIDFFLWDLAKRLERGDEKIEGIETAEMVPPHRTRSIWY